VFPNGYPRNNNSAAFLQNYYCCECDYLATVGILGLKSNVSIFQALYNPCQKNVLSKIALTLFIPGGFFGICFEKYDLIFTSGQKPV